MKKETPAFASIRCDITQLYCPILHRVLKEKSKLMMWVILPNTNSKIKTE